VAGDLGSSASSVAWRPTGRSEVSCTAMIEAGDAELAATPPAGASERPGRIAATAGVFDVCPYLSAADGGWRSAIADRDQRCGALRPAAPLLLSKQRLLCLTPDHRACATFGAAQSLEADVQGAARMPDSLLWPATCFRPLMLEPAHRFGPIHTLRRSRVGGQAILIGLMVVAFVIVAIIRSTPPGEGPGASQGASGASGPGGSPAAASLPAVGPASAPATAVPSPAPTSLATPSLSASPSGASATPAATPRATSSAGPTATGQYKVKAGDTLSGIAARFGTTVKVLKQLNNIDNVQLIRVGQVLIVP